MKKTANTLICRTFFCQRCLDNKFPQKGQLFLTIGRGRQKYEVHTVAKNGHFGYTPSIIEKTHVEGGIVTIAESCSMNGCQAVIELDEETGKYAVALLGATVHKIPIREWNGLVKFTKGNDYSLD